MDNEYILPYTTIGSEWRKDEMIYRIIPDNPIKLLFVFIHLELGVNICMIYTALSDFICHIRMI